MNRLTKDLKTPHDDTAYADIVKDAVDREYIVLTKLKHYEDLEENIGIDLITLFKALNGAWFIINKKAIYVGCPYLGYAENENRQLELQFRVGDIWYYVKDYGKTLALTKEELSCSKN